MPATRLTPMHLHVTLSVELHILGLLSIPPVWLIGMDTDVNGSEIVSSVMVLMIQTHASNAKGPNTILVDYFAAIVL